MKTFDKQKGFTLVEVLVAVIFVGIGIAALIGANMSVTRANDVGADLSTAEFLIEQMRERTAPLSFDDVNDFAAGTHSPPIDVDGNPINALSDFAQQVTVEYVDDDNFQNPVGYQSDFIRITVDITSNGKAISSASWIKANY